MSLLSQTHMLFPTSKSQSARLSHVSKHHDLVRTFTIADMMGRPLDRISRGSLMQHVGDFDLDSQYSILEENKDMTMMRRILASLPSTMVAVDKKGAMILYNRDTAFLLGVDIQVLSCVQFLPVLSTPSSSITEKLNRGFVCAVQHVLKSEEPVFVRHTMKRQMYPGDKVLVKYTIIPLLEPNSNLKYGAVILLERTDDTPDPVRDSEEERVLRQMQPSYFHNVFGSYTKIRPTEIPTIKTNPIIPSSTDHLSHLLDQDNINRHPKPKQKPKKPIGSPRKISSVAHLKNTRTRETIASVETNSFVEKITLDYEGLAKKKKEYVHLEEQHKKLQQKHLQLLSDFAELRNEFNELEQKEERTREHNVKKDQVINDYIEMHQDWIISENNYKNEIFSLKTELEETLEALVQQNGSVDGYMSNLETEEGVERMNMDGELDYWLVSILNPHEAVLMHQQPGSGTSNKKSTVVKLNSKDALPSLEGDKKVAKVSENNGDSETSWSKIIRHIQTSTVTNMDISGVLEIEDGRHNYDNIVTTTAATTTDVKVESDVKSDEIKNDETIKDTPETESKEESHEIDNISSMTPLTPVKKVISLSLDESEESILIEIPSIESTEKPIVKNTTIDNTNEKDESFNVEITSKNKESSLEASNKNKESSSKISKPPHLLPRVKSLSERPKIVRQRTREYVDGDSSSVNSAKHSWSRLRHLTRRPNQNQNGSDLGNIRDQIRETLLNTISPIVLVSKIRALLNNVSPAGGTCRTQTRSISKKQPKLSKGTGSLNKRRGSIEMLQYDEHDLDLWKGSNVMTNDTYLDQKVCGMYYCGVIETRDLQETLSQADHMNINSFVPFDVFEVSRLTGNRALEFTFMKMLHNFDLVEKLNLDIEKCQNFIQGIQKLYSPYNAYHSAIHGADVLHTAVFYLTSSKLMYELTPLEKLGLIIACSCHDVAHPGFTNQHLVQTSANVAIRYNDTSVLEHYHVATAFGLMRNEKYNLLSGLSKTSYFTIRKFIIELVLATDLAEHVKVVGMLKTRFVKSENNPCGTSPMHSITTPKTISYSPKSGNIPTGFDASDRLLLCKGIIKAADIGHPAKPWKLHFEWSARVTQEFYDQGDREMHLGLPVSSMNDRAKYRTIPKGQVGFVVFLVQPLYQVLGSVMSTSLWMKRVKMNKAVWQKLDEHMKKEDEKKYIEIERLKAMSETESQKQELDLKLEVELDMLGHQSVDQIYDSFETVIVENGFGHEEETDDPCM